MEELMRNMKIEDAAIYRNQLVHEKLRKIFLIALSVLFGLVYIASIAVVSSRVNTQLEPVEQEFRQTANHSCVLGHHIIECQGRIEEVLKKRNSITWSHGCIYLGGWWVNQNYGEIYTSIHGSALCLMPF